MTTPRLWGHAPIRLHGPEGELIESGYRWDRLRLTERLTIGIYCAAGVAISVAAPMSGMGAGALVLSAAIIGLMAFLAFLAQAQWSTVFTRDGRITRPHGRILGIVTRVPRFTHGEIASIELVSAAKGYGVAIYTTEGETFVVCSALRSVDARLVAVQLTKALREMREELSLLPDQPRTFTSRAPWVD